MSNKVVKSLVPDCFAINPRGNIFQQFQNIANELIQNYNIVKNNADSKKVIRYYFIELEFYYCSPSHLDIITYPRNAQAGDWFFHPSGVDICFQSNVHLNEETGRMLNKPIFDQQEISEQEAYGFGGILIRALRKEINGKTTYITGPLNCCYELFDQFSAFDDVRNFPRIEKRNCRSDITCASCGRYFNFSTNLETKLKNILHEYWELEYEELEDKDQAKQIFEDYLKQSYCFFDKKAFVDYNDERKNNKLCKTYYADPSKYEDKYRVKFKL